VKGCCCGLFGAVSFFQKDHVTPSSSIAFDVAHPVDAGYGSLDGVFESGVYLKALIAAACIISVDYGVDDEACRYTGPSASGMCCSEPKDQPLDTIRGDGCQNIL
jgi:hypothetical protein